LDANRSLCLNVRGQVGDTFDWRATVAKCDGSNGQKWTYDRSKQTIVNTVYNKCLDVFMGDITPGTMVSAADCNGTDAQKWTYDPTGQVLTNKLGNVLDVQGGALQPGQPVWTWPRNDGAAQHWFADQVSTIHIVHHF